MFPDRAHYLLIGSLVVVCVCVCVCTWMCVYLASGVTKALGTMGVTVA